MHKYITLSICVVFILAMSGCAQNDMSTTSTSANEQKETHVVIIPGYGAPVEGNPGYEAYVQSVADFVNQEENAVDIVLATGGYTVEPDTSEATFIVEYFETLTDTTNMILLAESCSIISWQNILFTAEILDQKGIEPTRITVFGDTARETVLMAYADYQFARLPANPTIVFEGHDFGTTDYVTPDTTEEIIAVYEDRSVGDEELQDRIERWTENFGYDVRENLIEKGCEAALPTT